MQEFHPLVSIIIPVYNGSNYMREAIDSALAQTYQNIEIIVVNDGSNDNGETERIARAYGDQIRYISKSNGGVSTALNTGIAHMRGVYFSWLSHDDVYTPDKVEKEVRALSGLENKETLILCESTHIDEHSRPIAMAGNKAKIALPENRALTWDVALMRLLRDGPFCGCAFLISKAVFDKCGGFDEGLRFYQDGFMWTKIFLNRYSLFCIPDVCVKGRIHAKQLTQTGRALFRSDCEKVSEYLIPELEKISTRERNFLYEYIKYNARNSNQKVAKKACRCANRAKLLRPGQWAAVIAACAWGRIRPLVRRAYYAFFHRIKTSQEKK